MIELATGKRWTIVSFGGLNITPACRRMETFWRSHRVYEGNSELYRLDTRTKAMQRLTVNASGDLSPSWVAVWSRTCIYVRSQWRPPGVSHERRWLERATVDL